MLASGAHISIDGVLLKLARDEDGRLLYSETFESLFSPTQAIAGEVAKDQIRPEKLLWSITDWSGGEGAKIYYPQDPTTYDVGSLINATDRGKLTTRPRRYRSSVARAGSNASTQFRPQGVSSFTHAIIGWEDNIITSTNAISWYALQAGSPDMSGQSFADAISDGTNAAFLYSANGNSGGDVIPVVQTESSVTGWADFHTGTSIDPPIVGAVLDGVPYTFGLTTGAGAPLALRKKAAVMDSAADWGATNVYQTGISVSGIYGEDYWTSCVSAETSLFFSYATKTGSFVWECRNDVGRPFWTAPPGFAVKKLVYKSGILFAIGNQSSAGGKLFAGIWAIPLATRSPIFISAPRQHQNTQLRNFDVGCGGPGATIFAGDSSSGKIFLYDIERDAIHLFDDLANGGTGDGMSFVANENLIQSGPAFNVLSQTDYNHELGTSGVTQWGANANCTISISGTKALVGGTSLRLTSSASGNMSAIVGGGRHGMEVSASTQYTASAWFISAVSARTCRVKITWYDNSGTSISTSTGTGAADNTSTWTQATVTATSPSTAVYAAVIAEVQSTGAGSETHYVDAVSLHAGSSTAAGDRIAFLALHGTRLFGATYKPLTDTSGTSLQIFSYDDLVVDNRDQSQAISGTLETAEWDMSLPMEQKALIGFYVTYKVTDAATTSGLLANSRIKVEYSLDDAAYATAATITSSTTPVGAKGKHFIQLSDGTTTYKFTRLKVKLTLDNNSTAVAPPVLYDVTVEAQPIAYARVWDLVVMVEDEESNERPSSRQESGYQIHTDLVALATNKDVVTFLDGAWSELPNVYDTHTVMVESPQSILGLSEGNGTMRLRLRSVLS